MTLTLPANRKQGGMVPTSIRSHTMLCVPQSTKIHTHIFLHSSLHISFFFCDFWRTLSPSHATGGSRPAILGSDTQSVAISSSLPAAEWTQRGVATKWNGHLWPALLRLLFVAPELEHGSFVLGARGHVTVHPPSFARPQPAWVPPFSSNRGRGRRHASADYHVAPPPRTPRRGGKSRR